jgi:hypothetical protein
VSEGNVMMSSARMSATKKVLHGIGIYHDFGSAKHDIMM